MRPPCFPRLCWSTMFACTSERSPEKVAISETVIILQCHANSDYSRNPAFPSSRHRHSHNSCSFRYQPVLRQELGAFPLRGRSPWQSLAFMTAESTADRSVLRRHNYHNSAADSRAEGNARTCNEPQHFARYGGSASRRLPCRGSDFSNWRASRGITKGSTSRNL